MGNRGWDDPVAHNGGQKNSLSLSLSFKRCAPRRPLILLSFRSHGIHSPGFVLRGPYEKVATEQFIRESAAGLPRDNKSYGTRCERRGASRRLPLLLHLSRISRKYSEQ